MRGIVVAAIVGLCIAGAAIAQDVVPASPPATNVFSPAYEPWRPSSGSHYPTAALNRGENGIVHLCCTADAERALQCEVAFEWPQQRGFGRAALALVHGAHLTPDSYAALQQRQTQRFAVPALWRLEPAPAGLDALVARANADAHDLCGPGTGDLPEYITVSGQLVPESTRGRVR